jgi:translation initiation factor RLI1
MKPFIDPELLADNCDSHHEEQVTRYFTDEELTQFKSDLADAHVQLQQRNQLVAAIKKLLKEDLESPVESITELLSQRKIEGESGTKSLSATIENLSASINIRSLSKTERVFVFYYPDENKAGVYNITGNLMYSRPMRPDERQSTIFSLNQKVSNE